MAVISYMDENGIAKEIKTFDKHADKFLLDEIHRLEAENKKLKSENSQWLQRKVMIQKAEIDRLNTILDHCSTANDNDTIGHLNEIKALRKREKEYIEKISRDECYISHLNEDFNKTTAELKMLKEENKKLQVRAEEAERYVLNHALKKG